MSVRRHPTNRNLWQVWYKSGPVGHKKSQCVVVDSEEEAYAADAKLKKQSPGRKQIVLCPVVDSVISEYIGHYSLEHLDTTNVTRSLNRWRSYVGKLQFPEIGEGIIDRYKHDRLNLGIKPTTINKELSALAGLLKWAAKRRYCDSPDFIDRFTAKKTKAPLPDVPTREEVLALINCMIWPKCGLFACLYFAGLRAGGSKGLRAEDVHLDRRVMIVTEKGNKQRVVPIVDELIPWLRRRINEVGTGLLWTTRNGKQIDDLDKIIEWAKKRAGITRRMTPHLLRHAYGTHATMAGVNIRTLQYAMGHSSSTTTEIYTTLGNNAIIDEITKKFGKII